jgi:hypothetical protein
MTYRPFSLSHTVLMYWFVFLLSSQAYRALLTIPFSDDMARKIKIKVLTESFPNGFQLLKDVDIFLMLGMDQLNILV